MAALTQSFVAATAPARASRAGRSRLVVSATSRVNQSKDSIVVAPSILSANFARLGEQVRQQHRRAYLPIVTS